MQVLVLHLKVVLNTHCTMDLSKPLVGLGHKTEQLLEKIESELLLNELFSRALCIVPLPPDFQTKITK
jgi:hypothetical protein